MLKKLSVVFVVLLVFIIAASAAFAETRTAQEIRMLLCLVLLKITAASRKMSFLMGKPGRTGTETAPEDRKTLPMRVRQKIRTQHSGVPSKEFWMRVCLWTTAVHRDHNQAGKHREKMSTYGRNLRSPA